nr:aldo/keto reductase [Halochromatium glycolicum]
MRVSRLGFGCARIASLTTACSPRAVRSTLDAAFDAGVNFFDTADIYGQGDSERMLGDVFSGRRADIILATKAGLTLSISQTMIRLAKPLANPLLRHWKGGRRSVAQNRLASERKRFEPGFLRERIESSLRRLRTDYIDLFMLHSPPVEVLQNQDVHRLLIDLRDAGKIRYLGVSCDDVASARAALAWEEIDSIQVPVSLDYREMLPEILPMASSRGVGVIAREVFAGGRLRDHPAIRQLSVQRPGLQWFEFALQFVQQMPEVSTVVIGVTTRAHLNANLNALASQPLPQELMTQFRCVT